MDDGTIKRKFEETCFDCRWYEWQNPDCINYDGTSFDHYWNIGRIENRDPSSMIDMTRFDNTLGQYFDRKYYSSMLVNKPIGRSFGVYKTWEDLKKSQFEYNSTLSTRFLKYSENKPKEFLVYVQAGPGSLHTQWYDLSLIHI